MPRPPDGKEGERKARRRSYRYVEDSSRWLTQPAGCHRNSQPEYYPDRLLGLCLRGGFEGRHVMEALPTELGLRAAEVTVARRDPVDRPEQVEFLDDPEWGEREDLPDDLRELLVGNHARASGVHHHRDRFRHADGVGKLHKSLAGKFGGDDVFG